MDIKTIKIIALGLLKHFRDYDLRSDPNFSYRGARTETVPQRHFCTFAAGYPYKLNQLESVATELKWFNSVISFNADERDLIEIGLDDRLKDFVKKNKRGYGYWLWKPYFVRYCLSVIPKGSILCYSDVGAEISRQGVGIFDQLIDMANDHGCLFFSLPFVERNWTKKSVLEQFPKIDGNTQQIQANLFFLKNDGATVDLIDDWVKYSTSDNFKNINDDTGDESFSFIEHRHDQSVLSCLVKKYGMKFIPQIDNFDRNLYKNRTRWIDKYPFHSLRTKTSLTYYK